MSGLDKLVTLSSLAQAVYTRWQFRQLLSGVIIAGGLIIVSSFMVSAMLIGGFYAAYLAFLHYGMEQQNAVFAILALFALVTAAFVFSTVQFMLYLRDFPRRVLKKSPMTARAGDAFNAFMQGLTAQD